MKKIIYIIIFIVSLGIYSCEDKLQLNPSQSLSDQTAFADAATARGTIFGVYHEAQDLHVFGSQPQIVGDYMADNVNFVGSFPTLQDINNYSHLADNGSTNAWWIDHYEVITNANLVIANIPDVEDMDDAEKIQIIGEAKFMRAITYFQLVNLFAQPVNVNGGSSPGVPLVLEPFTGEVTLPPRSTVEEVHQQIIADLQDAIGALPESYSSNTETRGRATSGAATALLARLYLYRGNYQSAADLAANVINNPNYSLAPDYTFYDQLTSEDVFTIINTIQDNEATGAGGWDSYYEGSNENGRGDCTFAQNLLDAYNEEPGDLRFTTLTETGVDAAGDPAAIFTTKFNDALNDASDAPLIRITELYLTRAEALAQLNGVNQESVDLINLLRQRAGLTDWTTGQFSTPGDFIDAILNERRKELAFEGHRRMDLLRNGLPLRDNGTTPASAPGAGIGISNPGDDKIVIAIPQDEVDLNPNLEQNPGF